MITITDITGIFEYNIQIDIPYIIRLRVPHACLYQSTTNTPNIKTPDYDKTKDKSWLIYQDCNYIYIFYFILFSILNFKLYR